MERLVEEIIKIDFEDIDKLNIPYNKKMGLIIHKDNIKYEFIVHLVDFDDNIVILGSSFLNRRQREKFKEKPVFERHFWYKNINHNVIYYNDPTKYDYEELGGGWGIGTPKTWHLENIATIIKNLAENITDYDTQTIQQYSNLFFYGSSMGGYMSLVLATLVRNSTAIADSPQFNLFYWWYFRHLRAYIFDELDDEEIMKYSHRLNIIELMNKEKTIPNSYINLECTDDRDWDTQYRYFLNHIKEVPFYFNTQNNKLNIKFDGKYGPKILSKYETIKLIDNVIRLENEKQQFNPIKLQMIDEIQKRISQIYNSYLEGKITFESFVKEKNNYYNKWNSGRVDLKNIGNENNAIEIITKSADNRITFPEWFKDEKGSGCTITSNKRIKLRFRTVEEGTLIFNFKGPHYLNKRKRHVPILICYNKFKINNQLEFTKKFLVWHNQPYIHEIHCEDKELYDVEIEFLTVNDYLPELDDFIKNMDENEETLDSKYEEFTDYLNKNQKG